MIGGLVDNEILPGNLRQDIIERTDGIPLFVEGDDEGFAGSRSRKRGKAGDCGRSVCSAGSPRKPARFPHGTARSARGAPPRKWRKSAQRLGMSFPCSACGRRGEARVGTQFSSRPAHYSRFASQLGGGDSKSDKVEGSQNVKFPLAGARTNTSVERGSMFCPERDRVMRDCGTKGREPIGSTSPISAFAHIADKRRTPSEVREEPICDVQMVESLLNPSEVRQRVHSVRLQGERYLSAVCRGLTKPKIVRQPFRPRQRRYRSHRSQTQTRS